MDENEALEYIKCRYPDQQELWKDYLNKPVVLKICGDTDE